MMTSLNTCTIRQAISPALLLIRTKLLRSILDEWSSKLVIDGAAKVISDSVETAENLAQWTLDSYRDQPHSITILTENCEKDIDPKLQKLATISTTNQIPDDSITHAFSHVRQYNRNDALWVFKKIFYALIPKGIAVVTCWRRNPVDDILNEDLSEPSSEGKIKGADALHDGNLADLAEEAQFERGKIRSFRKGVTIKGEELEKLISSLRESLEVGLGAREDGKSWSSILEDAVKQRTDGDGSLEFEAELILAMKWDLLCA